MLFQEHDWKIFVLEHDPSLSRVSFAFCAVTKLFQTPAMFVKILLRQQVGKSLVEVPEFHLPQYSSRHPYSLVFSNKRDYCSVLNFGFYFFWCFQLYLYNFFFLITWSECFFLRLNYLWVHLSAVLLFVNNSLAVAFMGTLNLPRPGPAFNSWWNLVSYHQQQFLLSVCLIVVIKVTQSRSTLFLSPLFDSYR